jgi:RNA polymerase sigma factor (sigma-70 family)
MIEQPAERETTMSERQQDWNLLRKFVDAQSQEAFAELTRRYLGLVHGTALRELGDRTLAEDVTQAVFLILARRAHTFRPNIVLAAWLFDTCRYTARNARRDERRRRLREQRAVMDMEQSADVQRSSRTIEYPMLNEALGRLTPADRQAVLLRFACEYSYAETGEAIGISENTARMRVERAIEKMRRTLKKGGVALSAATLADIMQTQSAQAVSPILSARVADLVGASSLPSVAGISADIIAQGALRAMKMTHLKIAAGITCGLILAGGVAYRGAARAIHPVRAVKTAAIVDTTPPVAPVATIDKSPDAEKARQILDEMFDTYGKMQALSATEISEGEPSIGLYRAEVIYQRPNRFRLNLTEGGADIQSVSDGAQIYVSSAQNPKRYLRKDVAVAKDGEAMAGKSALEQAMHGIRGNPLLLQQLLTDGEFLRKCLVASPTVTHTLETAALPDGVPVYRVGVHYASDNHEEVTETYAIGVSDHLLRQKVLEEQTGGERKTIWTVTFTDIRANPELTEASFQFEPSTGATAVLPPKEAASDGEALSLIDKMYDTYKELDAFSCDTVMTSTDVTQAASGGPARRDNRESYAVTVGKPFKAVLVRTGEKRGARAVSDGNTLYVTTSDETAGPARALANRKHYLKLALDSYSDDNKHRMIASLGQVGQGRLGEEWLASIALGGRLPVYRGPFGSTTYLGKPGVIDNEPVDHIVVIQNGRDSAGIPNGSTTMDVWTGHADHLIRRITVTTIRDDGARYVTTETVSDINTHLAHRDFTFEPPSDCQPLTSIDEYTEALNRRY